MQDVETWLYGKWAFAAGGMAAALLALAPLLAATWGLPLLLIFLHSPGYMLHQVEEHSGDRFRRFVNTHIFSGRDALTETAVLVINLPLVWGINLGALYAAALWGPAFGLVAPYAMLVNAVIHITAGLRLRCYNPGLATSLALFLPLGLCTLAVIGPVAPSYHIAGLGLAILVHLVIILFILRHVRQLQTLGATP